MPIEKKCEYKVCKGVEYTQNRETQIINLLKDVQENAALLNANCKYNKLDFILEMVEKGEWIIEDKRDLKRLEVELHYNLDLSQAKYLVNKYRNDSEGGCKSCKLREVAYPLPEESFIYCGKVEDKAFAIDNWSNNNFQSPTIKKFSEKGCPDKKPKLSRTIEEVLKEYNEEKSC
jgi:hypothetical protein